MPYGVFSEDFHQTLTTQKNLPKATTKETPPGYNSNSNEHINAFL